MISNVCGKLPCKKVDLNLKLTLLGGQSFRWTCIEKANLPLKFIGVAYGYLWELWQTENLLAFQVFSNSTEIYSEEYYNKLLVKYFRLDFDLEGNFAKWKSAHKHFSQTSSSIQSVRVLDQDPLENIISFMCSQNNNIKRISAMVEWLCSSYGDKICTHNDIDYFNFPSLTALGKSSTKLEENLRNAKFGYRAKFIAGAVKKINESGGNLWFEKLKSLPYDKAREELVTIPGIGFKVADCVCLMSLNHLEAVPVDTHIYKIAQTYYMPQLKQRKSVTPKTYDEVSKTFREIYGEYAGWAQAVLFCSGLQRFQPKSAVTAKESRKK